MAWNQLTLFATQILAEQLSDLMHELGAVAVTLKEGGKEQILEPLPGETPLWSDTQVVGLFELDQDIQQILQDLKQMLGQIEFPDYSIEAIPDKDWERAWLNDFKPMRFGKKLWIVPSAFKPVEDDAINIFLDPGLAFGTGTHATTALCLRWLDQHGARGNKVVDFGCGSGILAIAAAKLGAIEVAAVDIDPQAVEATNVNAKNNGVENVIHTSLSDGFEYKAADILLANILANPLMELAEVFNKMLKPNAKIVLSGILNEQSDNVLSKYQEWFDMDTPVVQDDWVLLSGKK